MDLYYIQPHSEEARAIVYDTARISVSPALTKLNAYSFYFKFVNAIRVVESLGTIGNNGLDAYSRLIFVEGKDATFLVKHGIKIITSDFVDENFKRDFFLMIHSIFGYANKSWEASIKIYSSIDFSKEKGIFPRKILYVISRTYDKTSVLYRIGEMLLDKTLRWDEVPYGEPEDMRMSIEASIKEFLANQINLISSRFKLGAIILFIKQQKFPLPTSTLIPRSVEFFELKSKKDLETLKRTDLLYAVDRRILTLLYNDFFRKNLVKDFTFYVQIKRYTEEMLKNNLILLKRLVEANIRNFNIFLFQSLISTYETVKVDKTLFNSLKLLNDYEDDFLEDFYNGIIDSLNGTNLKYWKEDIKFDKLYRFLNPIGEGVLFKRWAEERSDSITIKNTGDVIVLLDKYKEMKPIRDLRNKKEIDLEILKRHYKKQKVFLFSVPSNESITRTTFFKFLSNVDFAREISKDGLYAFIKEEKITRFFGFSETKHYLLYLIIQENGQIMTFEVFNPDPQDTYTGNPETITQIKNLKPEWESFTGVTSVRIKEIFNTKRMGINEFNANILWYISCRSKHLTLRGILRLKFLFNELDSYVGNTFYQQLQTINP